MKASRGLVSLMAAVAVAVAVARGAARAEAGTAAPQFGVGQESISS